MSRPLGSKNTQWNKDELQRLYWDEGLNLREIGCKLGVVSQAVLQTMKKFGIKRRTKSEVTRGEKHYNWKGGRYLHKDGYVYVKAENHPRKSNRGYVFEHVLIVEKHLNRFLRKGEVVHHFNGIKTDNRIENLIVMRQQDHSNLIPLFKKRIRVLEEENKTLRQQVMKI
jgi:hypothetical protein